MRDLSTPIRTACFTALTGNTGGINMYDEKRKVSATDNTFIVFSTQQQTVAQDENDCTWVNKCAIDIEIYNKTASEVSKDTIDDIANRIVSTLLPTVGVPGITASNIQFVWAACESIISRNISLSETESIMQKVVRMVFTVVQQGN